MVDRNVISFEMEENLRRVLPERGIVSLKLDRDDVLLKLAHLKVDARVQEDKWQSVVYAAINEKWSRHFDPQDERDRRIKELEEELARVRSSKIASESTEQAVAEMMRPTSTADEDPRGLRLAVAEENSAAAMNHLRGIGWDIPAGANIADAAEIVAQRIDWQRAARDDEAKGEEPDLTAEEVEKLRAENERLAADLTAHGEAADVAEGDLRREVADLTAQRDKAAQAYQRAMDGHRLIRLASDSALAGECNNEMW